MNGPGSAAVGAHFMRVAEAEPLQVRSAAEGPQRQTDQYVKGLPDSCLAGGIEVRVPKYAKRDAGESLRRRRS